MKNISNQISAYNTEFLIGDIVVIKTQLEFVDRCFSSDSLFTVANVLSSGITIEVEGKLITASSCELRTAMVAELNAKRRLENCIQLNEKRDS